MRNVDQIKLLKEEKAALRMEVERLRDNEDAMERELGRYKKKADDDRRQIERLMERLGKADRALTEIHGVMNAILVKIAQRYGERAMDPDDESVQLGWRIAIDRIDVAECLEHYEVHARVDERTGERIVGVSLRADEA